MHLSPYPSLSSHARPQTVFLTANLNFASNYMTGLKIFYYPQSKNHMSMLMIMFVTLED